jgi:hypothetical protein
MDHKMRKIKMKSKQIDEKYGRKEQLAKMTKEDNTDQILIEKVEKKMKLLDDLVKYDE